MNGRGGGGGGGKQTSKPGTGKQATYRALLLRCTDGLRARFFSLPRLILISLLALRLFVANTRKKIQELLLYFIRPSSEFRVIFGYIPV